MNPDISESEETSRAANAVSLFGQSGGVSDFPVLKAFQEYIDAEQAKARKRMFGLSIFFIVLLVVVVVTFTIVMTSVISRNQALSDRLLDIALREKNPAQPVVNVQSPAPSPVVQPVLQHTSESPELARLREELQREKEARQADLAKRDKEKIDSLTAALAKAQQQPVASAPVVVTTSPTPVVHPAAESAELIRLREELRREKETRKAEKDKREKEKKEAEKQAFLRRQYPDYYKKEDARKAAAAAAVAPQPPAEPDSAKLNRQREELRREEAKQRQEEEARRKAAEEAKREEEARRRAAEEARREEEARRRAAEEARRKAEKERAALQTAKKTASPLPGPTLKAITYFDDTKPTEDPELKELLNRTSAARTVPQAAPKSASQPAAKPAPTTPVQPVATQQPVQQTAQPTRKTETLAIGGAADGSSIPWLIELPVQ